MSYSCLTGEGACRILGLQDQDPTTEEMEMETYIITIEEETGAIISQEDVENDIGPMDALRQYAAENGWTPEYEELDFSQNMQYWEMTESDGTHIVVEELDKKEH
jgi:hypothetical protein